MNPGPSPSQGPSPDENTRLILQAIAENKDEVKGVKYQVDCVQRELGILREEIAFIKSKVDGLKYGQEITIFSG